MPIESNQNLELFFSFCSESENKIKHLDYQASFGGICQLFKGRYAKFMLIGKMTLTP